MQRPEPGKSPGENIAKEDSAFSDDQAEDLDTDSEAWGDGGSFDWIVFLLRASALVTIGAMLITSVDLSRNQGADWVTVMRLAILPFVGAMILLAAAELIDRKGD